MSESDEIAVYLTRCCQFFLLGIQESISGIIVAVTEPHIRQVYSKHMKYLFGISLSLFLLGRFVLLPVQLLGFLFRFDTSALVSMFQQIIFCLPFVVITIVRFFWPVYFERFYFAGLKSLDEDLALQLQNKKAVYWDWAYLTGLMKFVVRMAVLSFLCNVLPYFVPFLAPLIPLLKFGYKIRRMDLFFSMLLFVAFNTHLSRTATTTLELWITSKAVSRELFDPFLARNNTLAILYENTGIVFGFTIVFAALLNIAHPALVPFVWIFGYVSAGRFTKQLIGNDAKGVKSI